MPCTYDNWDSDGCDYEPAPSHSTALDIPPEHQKRQPHEKLGVKEHCTTADKDSCASPMTTPSSDNGRKPASLLSHNSTPCSQSLNNKESDYCHRREKDRFCHKSNSPQTMLTFDSRGHQKQRFAAADNTCPKSSVEETMLTDDSINKPPALTTSTTFTNNTAIDEGSSIAENKNDTNNKEHPIREQQSYLKDEVVYSQRDRSPISINISELSSDLPKAAISPGVKGKGFPYSPNVPSKSPMFEKGIDRFHHNIIQSFIESDKEFHSFPGGIKRDFHFSPRSTFNDKVSTQTASSSRLYNLLHCTSSGEHCNGKSKYYTTPFDTRQSSSCTSSASFLNPPTFQTNIGKSSPELRSYCNLQVSPHFPLERNRIRTLSHSDIVTDSPIISSSQSKIDSSANDCGSSAISIKSENVSSSPSSPDYKIYNPISSSSAPWKTKSNDESCSPELDNSIMTSSVTSSSTRHSTTKTTVTRLMIKKEEDLSPGRLSHHRLSTSSSSPTYSPYNNISSSLSPWSDCGGDFGYPDEGTLGMLGIPIKNKTKCASDSSLFLPQMIQPSLSPDLSSSVPTPDDSIMVECRWKSCSQTFQSQKSLAQHVNDYHIRIERPDVDFQCHWQGCPRQGKGFNARYKMLIHIRTHTNEKPHKCAVCRKCFSRLENLKIHMRSHTGEKPYACTFPGCTKAYSNSSDRFKHVRTHQEEKPYKCKMPGCHKQYTDPSSLRKHVRTHNHCIKYDQSPLRKTASEDANNVNDSKKEFNQTSTSSGTHPQHSMEIQDNVNKALEMDADRQRKSHWLEGKGQGQNDMTDIQRNIELNSSLEVKVGIQKFGQIENCIQEDYHPTEFARVSHSPQRHMDSELTKGHASGNPQINFDHLKIHSHPKHPFLSVPTIVIDQANDCCKSTMMEDKDVCNGEKDKFFAHSCRENNDVVESEKLSHSRGLKRRIIEENRGEEEKSTVKDDTGDMEEDFKTNMVQDRVGSSCSSGKEILNIPSSFLKNTALPPLSTSSSPSSSSSSLSSSSSSSSSSHPKHWKKRKILDEQRQQEEEEEKKHKEEQHTIEEAAKELETSPSPQCSPPFWDRSIDKGIDVAMLNSKGSSSPATIYHYNDDTSLNLLQKQHQQQQQSPIPSSHHASLAKTTFQANSNQLLESSVTSTDGTIPSSPKMSHINMSPRISPDSLLFHPAPPSSLSPTSNSSQILPHHHRHIPLPPHLFLPPSSILSSYPELQRSPHSLESPSLSHLSSLPNSAMLLANSHKSCRDTYFPHLSALMDVSLSSSSLDSLTASRLPLQSYPFHPSLAHALPLPHPYHHLHHTMNPATTLICPVSLSLPMATRTFL